MENRWVLIYCFIFFNLHLSGQFYNIIQKSHISGMPGNVYNDVWGYVDNSGKEYAIVGSSAAINIYDVSDCSNPIRKMSYIDGSTVNWRDFKTYRNYAYGVCDGGACTEGLEIITLDNYTVSHQTNVFIRAHNIFIDTSNARLYVVGSNVGGLLIYALNNPQIGATPANPVLLKHHNTSYIHDIYVRDNIGYASHGYEGTKVWDFNDVNNIVLLTETGATGGYNHSSWLNTSGTHLFSAEELPRGVGIQVFEVLVSGISSYTSYINSFKEPLEAPFSNNPRPHNPFIKNDTLYISYYEDGLQVFDVSNPMDPKKIAYFDSYTAQNGLGYDLSAHDWKGQWGVYPFLPSGCILISDITQGFYTVKLNIPKNDGINIDKLTKMSQSGFYIADSNKGIVLRSPKGYCFKLSLNESDPPVITRINCDITTENKLNLESSDLVIDEAGFPLIFKITNQNCKQLKIDASGILTSILLPSCPNESTSLVKITDADVYIQTYTKGFILKGDDAKCYKITVNDAGVLQLLTLSYCP